MTQCPRLRSLLLLLATAPIHAQTAPLSGPGAQTLPSISTLMREVELNERNAEALARNYTYREVSTLHEIDNRGAVKKTEQTTFDIYTVDGITVTRPIARNGKNLTPDELKREDDRIDKQVAKAKEHRARADAQGNETDSRGHDEITLARILELGTFSNPRRENIDGRPTILVDYTGDPHAKTHSPGEAAMKVLTGTVWVDEQDRAVRRIEAHFFADFKLGGGLLADIRKDTAFTLVNNRVNGEVWLPATLDAHGKARYLLFFSINGDVQVRASDYRKFRASSTILPKIAPAPPNPNPDAPP